MPQKVRIALDAMGGDVGASVVVPGAAASLARHPDTEFLLVGKREDTLRRSGGDGWLIARRKIILDQNVLMTKNLTFFF